jgi:hypothetical protein
MTAWELIQRQSQVLIELERSLDKQNFPGKLSRGGHQGASLQGLKINSLT